MGSCMYAYFLALSPEKAPEKHRLLKDQAMSTPSTQILVSKYYFPIKVTDFLGEMTDLKSLFEKIQVESRALCVGRK